MAWTNLGTVAPGDVLRANSGTAAYNNIIGNLNYLKPLTNVQQGTVNTSASYSTASTWQNTALAVTITPTFSTSKVLISMSAYLSVASGNLGNWRIVRGASTVLSPSRTDGAGGGGAAFNGLTPDYNTSRNLTPAAFVTLDSPGVSTAVTYTLQVWHGAAVTVFLNRWALDVNWVGTSSIMAQEIPV
jgi:hypothetical protein